MSESKIQEVLQKLDSVVAPPKEEKKVIIELGMADYAPILSVPCQTIDFPLSSEDKQTILDIKLIMQDKGDEAYGLAAPQIGIPRQIFLMWDRGHNLAIIINPVIINKDRNFSKKIESCLSIPGFSCWVPRPKSLTIQYQDENGNTHSESFMGIWARIIAHEMDHLNGRLINHYLSLQMEKELRRQKEIKAKRVKTRLLRKK